MNKAILGAGAALAALALAGAANAQQGYAGLEYSTLDVEGFDVDVSLWRLPTPGSSATPMSSSSMAISHKLISARAT